MSKELTTNLVIVGAGAAGLMAAISAYELGEREIIVLEKTKVIGGGGRCALGPGGIGSPVQERLGIKYDMDKEFLKYMNWCHWKSDAKLVRTYLEHSGDFIRWGEEHGLVFQTVLPSKPDDAGESRVVHVMPSTGGVPGGVASVNKIVEVIQEYGITCYTKAVTKRILVSEGRAAGVETEIDGEETIIHAKCVMIATGNFGANKELVHKHWPNYRGEDIDFVGLPQMVGDGITLVGDAGGRLQDIVDFWSVGPAYLDNRNVAYEMSFALKWPATLWVNKYGERFVDESLSSRTHTLGANALNLQQDKMCYTLFDSSMLAKIIEGKEFNHEHPNLKSIKEAASVTFHGSFFALNPETLEKEVAAGRTVRADSWEELAEKLGMDPVVLLDTVTRYNAYCEAGHDEEMSKEPKYLQSMNQGPFYAMRGYSTFDLPIGGIVINHKAQVLREEDLRPFPGLYSAGDIAWNGMVGSGLVDFWTPFSTALTMGMVAGRSMANEIAICKNT